MYVSIVPDTNVFLNNLEAIESLYKIKGGVNITVFVCKTVYEELDYQKANYKARAALKFIFSVKDSIYTEIEGHVDERKMEIIVEQREKIKEANNDDKIINYCLKLENPILLTYDRGLSLKAMSSNIKAIEPSDADMLIKYIKNDIPISFEDKISIKNDILEEVQPFIDNIIKEYLGENYYICTDKLTTLESYIDFILKNRNIFIESSRFPKYSFAIITKFRKVLEVGTVDDVKEQAGVFCLLFGCVYK